MIMYTDGGSYNNGNRKGDGSWAYLIVDENNQPTDEITVVCEFIQNTTNNRTEMMAVIEGLKYLNDSKINTVTIVSDSKYLVNGWTNPAYLKRWIANGWRTSTNTPVQNQYLWEELQRLSWHIGFDFIHIRGHMKDKRKEHAYWNDIVDRACTWAMENKMLGMIIKLSYNVKTKEFTPITVKLKEN